MLPVAPPVARRAPEALRIIGPPMHLIVPYAGTLSEAGRQALGTLSLPALDRLLARLAPARTIGSDEYSLSAPHELAIAEARGWDLADGLLPWAADAAARAGIDPGEHAWAVLTPVHVQLDSDRASLTDPAALALDADSSRALLDAVRPLFDSEGFRMHWAAPDQWLAAHPLFDGLAMASLDRVIGRALGPWLPEQRQARLLRRLQNEAQMLLHDHPLNAEREASGLPAVNSFWCSGCGRAPSVARVAGVTVDASLRGPALGEDWAAWREAWSALDAGPLNTLLQSREPLQLTLCGERVARRLEARPRSLWQRLRGNWHRQPAAQWLESL